MTAYTEHQDEAERLLAEADDILGAATARVGELTLEQRLTYRQGTLMAAQTRALLAAAESSAKLLEVAPEIDRLTAERDAWHGHATAANAERDRLHRRLVIIQRAVSPKVWRGILRALDTEDAATS